MRDPEEIQFIHDMLTGLFVDEQLRQVREGIEEADPRVIAYLRGALCALCWAINTCPAGSAHEQFTQDLKTLRDLLEAGGFTFGDVRAFPS